MKFYVAGKWEEREQVRQLQDELRRLGHTITVDWTWHEFEDGGYPVQYAQEDVFGAATCDAYVGRFVNPNSYKGALVEMGVALGLGKKVFVIGHAIDTCIFVSHPLVTRCSNTKKFFEELRNKDA